MTSMFICMPQINFIIQLFLKILHFKESCNLIGWQRFGPELENQNFQRHWIDGEISIAILVFTLGYFQEKIITKSFKKSKKSKKPYFGPFLLQFGQKWTFLEKRTRPVSYFNDLKSCQKSEKNNESFLRKIPNGRMDRLTERSTDRKWWFIEPSVERGPNNVLV